MSVGRNVLGPRFLQDGFAQSIGLLPVFANVISPFSLVSTVPPRFQPFARTHPAYRTQVSAPFSTPAVGPSGPTDAAMLISTIRPRFPNKVLHPAFDCDSGSVFPPVAAASGPTIVAALTTDVRPRFPSRAATPAFDCDSGQVFPPIAAPSGPTNAAMLVSTQGPRFVRPVPQGSVVAPIAPGSPPVALAITLVSTQGPRFTRTAPPSSLAQPWLPTPAPTATNVAGLVSTMRPQFPIRRPGPSIVVVIFPGSPVNPVGPTGVPTFALLLEAGLKVTYSWETDVIKTKSGREQHRSIQEAPSQAYAGAAWLADGDVRKLRGQLAKVAAQGATYQLALPFEGVTLTADSAGTTVSVGDTTKLDWAVAQQQVILIANPDGSTAIGVIQSVGPTSIVLDVTPNPATTGKAGNQIMPIMPVLLDAQQAFARQPVNLEQWQIKATAALFGFGAIDTMGAGATVNTYQGKPLYDVPLENMGSLGDSMQSMLSVVKYDGLPAGLAPATVPDWGREIVLSSNALADWQWVKAFLFTIRGSAVSFFLPTWRPDFIFVSSGASTLTIAGPPTSGAGDFFALFGISEAHRDLQLRKADGSVQYTRVLAAADNGNGTITLQIDAALVTGVVTMVSWVELCRLESDDVDVTFVGPKFAIDLQARVIQPEGGA